MTDIYIEIAKLTDKFRTMAFGITTDENKIHEAVQELMLYLLQANPDVIKKIYDNDGIEGITRYGAVALRRALTSKRSNFYYKYEKYYTHIDSFRYNTTTTGSNIDYSDNNNYHQDISNLPNEETPEDIRGKKLDWIDEQLESLDYWYDRELFKLYYYGDGNTLDGLAAKTRISRNSIFNTIDKVRKILKEKLNEDV
jgi:hypothetical protein